eukprot:gene4766-14872_t
MKQLTNRPHHLSYEQWAKHILDRSCKRAERDMYFLPTTSNIARRRTKRSRTKGMLSTHSSRGALTTIDKARKFDLREFIPILMQCSTLGEAAARKDLPMPVRQLFTHCHVMSSHCPGTDAWRSVTVMRKALGMMFHFGCYSIFMTINPNASGSALLLRLCGHHVNSSLELPLTDVMPVYERLLNTARHPWTVLRWHWGACTVYWSRTARKAPRHRASMYACDGTMPGAIGWVKCAVAMSECSPGGQLHTHGCFSLLHPPHDVVASRLQRQVHETLLGMLRTEGATLAGYDVHQPQQCSGNPFFFTWPPAAAGA